MHPRAVSKQWHQPEMQYLQAGEEKEKACFFPSGQDVTVKSSLGLSTNHLPSLCKTLIFNNGTIDPSRFVDHI